MRSWRDRVASARACAHEAQECARAPRLDELPQDALREILRYLKVPLALKLTCRAVRAAAPEYTISYSIHALRTINFFTWAYKNGMRLTHGLATAVAREGNLDALLFMKTVGQPDLSNNLCRYACPAAAECGHLHILKRFMKTGTMGVDNFRSYELVPILNWAVYGGHRRVAEWMLETFPTELKYPQYSTLTSAARGGQLDMMKWLHFELGCPWDGTACTQAAKNGHLHVLKWLYHEARFNSLAHTHSDPGRQPWPTATISSAAQGGHMHVLVWLNDTIGQLGAWHFASEGGWCDDAARIGRLDILKYAHEQGVAITPNAAAHAAENGHVHVLEWVCSVFGGNDPFSHAGHTISCLESVAQRGRLEVLKWCHAHGLLRVAPDRLFKAASNYVQDETAAWLYETFGHEACYGDSPSTSTSD
jgi:hypothetical protein